jgi:hypothetical protein
VWVGDYAGLGGYISGSCVTNQRGEPECLERSERGGLSQHQHQRAAGDAVRFHGGHELSRGTAQCRVQSHCLQWSSDQLAERLLFTAGRCAHHRHGCHGCHLGIHRQLRFFPRRGSRLHAVIIVELIGWQFQFIEFLRRQLELLIQLLGRQLYSSSSSGEALPRPVPQVAALLVQLLGWQLYSSSSSGGSSTSSSSSGGSSSSGSSGGASYVYRTEVSSFNEAGVGSLTAPALTPEANDTLIIVTVGSQSISSISL